jgi:UrcA family protein
MEDDMKLLASAAAALGLMIAATPAMAQAPEQRAVTFTTSDIDLATPKGQKELNWRIERAVRHVCQTRSLANGSNALTKDAQTCIAKARANAQRQVARIMAGETQKGG